ncbi:MAG: tyrosine-type recombinase/integrase [Lachnospiraceae bacterium]|nr:tyrosine-type recombinase/integrase [Lachnospiraceae bacterium]
MARKGENIRKRSDGRWEARIITGYSETRKAIYKSVYGKTYTEVRTKRNVFIQENMINDTKRIRTSQSEFTFGQLMDQWLFSMKNKVKESTYAKYNHLIKAHIQPVLGGYLLKELDNQCLDQFIEQKLTNGKLNGSGGLSPKTVSDLLSLVSQVIRFGNERGYPCAQNLVIHYPKQIKPQIKILSDKQQKTLESYLFEHKDSISMGIILSLYTGLRIGEVCGLKWGDFCLDENLLYVERTLMRIQNTDSNSKTKTKILIDKPKSDCSIRIVPISSFLIPYLQTLKKGNSCYFLTGTCNYMEPRMYFKKYKVIMENCDLGEFNYHALRHTFATRCVEKGFDMKSLSEILGHADVTTTFRRYVHPSINMKKKQIELLKCNSI